MFSKRTAGVILVALLAVVAGCSGGGSSSDGPTATATDAGATTDSMDTTTADDGDGTATTTGEDGDGTTATTTGEDGDGTTATTTGEGGDGTTATPTETGGPFADYAAKVREAGGYVAEVSFETTSESIPVAGNWTIRRNLETGSALLTFETTRRGRSVRVEQYHPSDTDRIHQCVIVGGSCTRAQTVPASEASAPNVSTPFGGSVVSERPDLTEAGTVDTEYGTLTRYRVASVDALPESARSGPYGTYEEFRMDVLVEPDTGLVRRVTVESVVETRSGTAELTTTIEYVEYGAVEVEAPDWYDG